MLQDIGLFLAGLVVGGMNAIAGGGILFGFPIMLATGLPPLVANATSNIIVLPGSLASAYGYRKYIRKVPRQYILLLVPCLIGAIIGALILRHTPTSRFETMVPGLIFFAVLLFAFQPFLHHHLHTHMKSKKKALQPLALIAVALFPVAIYGGYFGAGFGFIMLAFLGFTKLHDIHKMNGLKNLASATICIASLICLFSAHLIDWHTGIIMAAGASIGGYYGSQLAQKVPTHAIRIIVILIGLATAGYLAFRNY
jgi:uncharacterized membrane protein YfcA